MELFARSDIVREIEKVMLKEIEVFATNSFEYSHYHDVHNYACILAERRHLDINIAKIASMLHDIARIRYGYVGKQHAKEGALIARNLLEPYGDRELTETVEIAIKNHRDKSNIHDSYSELIKDADAMAHKQEFGPDNIKWSEELRITVTDQVATDFILSDKVTIKTALIDYIDSSIKCMTDIEKKGLSKKNIHQLRVAIRSIRSVIWLLENYTDSAYKKKLKGMKSYVKGFFSKFEAIRAYQVYVTMLKTDKMFPFLRKYFKEQVSIERETLSKYLQEEPFVATMTSFKSALKTMDLTIHDEVTFMLYKSYQGLLMDSSVKDINSLHALRIGGKKLKYLHHSGLLVLPEVVYKQINKLHKHLGDLHDYDEMLALITSHKFISRQKKIKAYIKGIESYIDQTKLHQIEIVKPELLSLKLMMR